jgi:hypothetical protein
MMFYYGVFATSVLSIGIILEYVIFSSLGTYNGLDGAQKLRLLSYNRNQWYLLFVTAVFNAISLNFLTLAF